MARPKKRTLMRIQKAEEENPARAVAAGILKASRSPSAPTAVMPEASTSVAQNPTARTMTARARWPAGSRPFGVGRSSTTRAMRIEAAAPMIFRFMGNSSGR